MRSYKEHLLDKDALLHKKMEQVTGEISRIQGYYTQAEKGLEKYSKSLKMKHNRKHIHHLEPFSFNIVNYYKELIKKNSDLQRALKRNIENFCKVKKSVDTNKRILNKRILKNQKLYNTQKTMLEECRKKQIKAAREAQEWYIKHSTQLDAKVVNEDLVTTLELKLVEAVNEEKRFSRQYENVVRQTTNYQEKYLGEKKLILERYEKFDHFVNESVKKELLGFVAIQRKHLEGVTEKLNQLENALKNFDSNAHLQRFIEQNHDPFYKVEKKHVYDPFVPIYRRPPEEQQKLLKEAKEEDPRPMKASKRIKIFLGKAKLRRLEKNTDGGKGGNRHSNNNGNMKAKVITTGSLKVSDTRHAMEKKTKGGGGGQGGTKRGKYRHKRTRTEGVVEALNKREKVKIKMKKKTKEVLHFEALLQKLLSVKKTQENGNGGGGRGGISSNAVLSDSEVQEAMRMIETQAGRLGLSLAMNYRRSSPYVAEFKSFDILASLVKKCLIMSHESTRSDKDVGRLLLNMCHTFYTIGVGGKEQLYLLKHLSDMKIWKDIRFWEGAFYDTMSDMRSKSDYYLTDSRWKDLDEAQRKESETEHINFTFAVLTSMVFSMVECNLDTELVKRFITKVGTLNQLGKERMDIVAQSFEDRIKEKRIDQI